jgi:short-subunit dehydrogenase
MSEKRFSNQIVLVTGASMGIGREIALAFARDGARLVLAARSREKLQSVEEEIKGLGSEALCVSTDLTSVEQTEALVRILAEKFGRLDVLVNNAGKGLYSRIESMALEDFREIFELNFFSIIRLTQKCLPWLRKSDRRSVVNIDSIAGQVTVPKMVAYCASKFALCSFSEGLRVEWAPEGVHVLTVYPGVTDTEFSSNARAVDGRPSTFMTPGRGISARKVADKIVSAVARQKAELYITLSDRLAVWAHFFFPRLVEWGMRKFVK